MNSIRISAVLFAVLMTAFNLSAAASMAIKPSDEQQKQQQSTELDLNERKTLKENERLMRLFETLDSNEMSRETYQIKSIEKIYVLSLFLKCMNPDTVKFYECVDASLATRGNKQQWDDEDLDEFDSADMDGKFFPDFKKRSFAGSSAAAPSSAAASANDKEIMILLRNALAKNIRLKSNIKTTRF